MGRADWDLRHRLNAFVRESAKEPDEALEDLCDLAVIERRKDEPTIPLTEIERRLERTARRKKGTKMKTVRNEPEIVLRNGKPAAVILPLKEYEALLERAEDVEDARWLRQRRKQKTSFRTLEEFLADCPPDV